jgi:muramoyltetrapeptide carboxypeptidase LdcA involved in peptidoglycan recycling
MIKPTCLHKGDTIATVTLSWGGPAAFPERYQVGKKQLEDEFGIRVVEMPHTLSDDQWLHHHPPARAHDLMQAFCDPTIKAIISTIGGDDSIRILPYLDLELIHSHPKIFMGYSDTTAIHLACYKARLSTFYGPSIMAGFAENGGLFSYMIESVRKTLFSNEPIGEIQPNQSGWTVERLEWGIPENQQRKRTLQPCNGWKFLQGKGVHQGRLLGGCFEVLDWLRGMDFFPSPEQWQGAILFLETSGEAPSPLTVKRGLRSLAAMGILSVLTGIVFGRPGGNVPVVDFEQYDEALLEVIRGEQGLNELPIITHMDFGHSDPMFVLPYGAVGEIDCSHKAFSILECCVID